MAFLMNISSFLIKSHVDKASTLDKKIKFWSFTHKKLIEVTSLHSFT